MDTHFEQNLPRSSARPELSLPGEDELSSTLHAEPKDRLGAPHASGEVGNTGNQPAKPAAAEPAAPSDAAVEKATKPASKRRGVLITSAAVGVIAVAAAGVFLISPYNHILPLDLTSLLGNSLARPGATQHIAIPAPVAPAANLARAPARESAPAPNRPMVSPQPRTDEMQEIVNLRRGRGGEESSPTNSPADDRQAEPQAAPPTITASVDAASAPPLAAAQSVTPITTPVPAAPPVAAITAVAPAIAPTPPVMPITPVAPITPASVATPTPSNDSAANAVILQAAPMSTPQQIEVLNVVAELGVLMRNQRAENAQLRADVQQMRERLDTQLNDYGRRLSLAEARGAISAAMGAGVPATMGPSIPPMMPGSITVTGPLPPFASAAPRGPRAGVPAPAVAAASSPASQDGAPRRYRVQAASPGLAMLAEVDRSGDAGSLLQVSIGDEVPGFGRVKSIAQQGTAWVLTAEHGLIR